MLGDKEYFAVVNGFVCIADSTTCLIEETFDLNEAYDQPSLLGWCRGLHVEGGRLFVGFSSLRSTRIRENLAWVKRGFKGSIEEAGAMPTRIVEYDVPIRQIVKEVDLSSGGLDAVFSMHSYNDG